MIMSYVKSYKEVILQVDELVLAKKYLSMRLGKKYFSYLRKDKHKSASLYFSRNGRLRYNDFMNNLSLPEVICLFNDWSYRDFLINVSKDFCLRDIQNNNNNFTSYKKNKSIRNNIINITDNKTKLRIKIRKLEEYDIDFWSQYNISNVWLSKAKIVPISYFWIINNKGNYKFKAEKLSYSYNYYWYKGTLLRKIYQPYSRNKWFSNINNTVVQGWDMIPKHNGKTLIITSSYKDIGAIECNTLGVYNKNYIPAIAPNNEMCFLPEKIISKINNRFKRIIVWFDNDKGGITGAKRYKEKYGYEFIHTPFGYPKDPSDFIKEYGKNEFINLLNTLI